MNAHTPGPWWTKREGFSTVYVFARIGGGMVQEVAACGPTAAGPDQQGANARLLAAAPKMLNALRQYDQAFTAFDPDSKESRHQMRLAVVAARAAIAEADGESP